MGRRQDPGNGTPGERAGRALGQVLWVLIPALTLGFFAFVPAVHVSARARSRGWWLIAGLMVAATAGEWTAMAMDAEGPGPGFLIMGVVSGGIAAAVAGRDVVFGDRAEKKLDPEIETVLDNRERREKSREIASTDPEMALELGIGRPDLGSYNDGGLIDLNNASAQSITTVLGWRSTAAAEFVAERKAREGYETITEIAAMSSLDPKLLEKDDDRIVLLPYQGP